MATTIKQIKKVNIYEEDKEGLRTLVQSDVPLGSNVVMKKEAPAEELYLLTGKEDTIANTITLYPTKVKVTSDGSIDAKDFTIKDSSLKSDYVSTMTWEEGEETSKDGIKTYARRLYYHINSNPFQVKDETNQSLNLLRVPYLALYSTNTIKTEKEKDPLYLNVENVTVSRLANNTKVVLGHTAIKNSTLDIVDNTNGYLRARLGADMTNNYGYLNFFKTITENNVTTNYEIGSIFAASNELCIMPRKIPCPDINTIDKNKEIKNNNGEVIGGSIGASLHKFRDVWAENFHGNVNVVSYTSEISPKTTLEILGAKDQLIYIGTGCYKSILDMPYDTENGFCITLSSKNNPDSPTSGVRKQIFIRGGTKNTRTEKRIYIRTCHSDSYGQWQPALGETSWNVGVVCNDDKTSVVSPVTTITIKGKEYTLYKVVKNKPKLVINRNFLEIYQNYNKFFNLVKPVSIVTIQTAIDDYKKMFPDSNACGVIEIYYKKSDSITETVHALFNYNQEIGEVCLYDIIYPKNLNKKSTMKFSFKQYD